MSQPVELAFMPTPLLCCHVIRYDEVFWLLVFIMISELLGHIDWLQIASVVH